VTPLDAPRRAPGFSPLRTFIVWTLVAGSVAILFRLFYRITCKGREHLPYSGAAIYAANHQSHFDPPAIGSMLRERPCAFVAQSGLFAFKPFAWMISYFGSIPLDRGTKGTDAMRAAIGALKAGKCLLIFPEGTRCEDGEMAEFLPGVLMLARRTGAAVVPVAIDGTYDVWPRSRRLPRPWGRIKVSVATPIPAAELTEIPPEEALARLRTQIAGMLEELRGN
jgi:1-acyl-sn-glycerol-3-phosphate acyltransferase